MNNKNRGDIKDAMILWYIDMLWNHALTSYTIIIKRTADIYFSYLALFLIYSHKL